MRKYRVEVSTWFLHHVFFTFPSTFTHSLLHVSLGFCIIVHFENLNVLGVLQIYGPLHRQTTMEQVKRKKNKNQNSQCILSLVILPLLIPQFMPMKNVQPLQWELLKIQPKNHIN